VAGAYSGRLSTKSRRSFGRIKASVTLKASEGKRGKSGEIRKDQLREKSKKGNSGGIPGGRHVGLSIKKRKTAHTQGRPGGKN